MRSKRTYGRLHAMSPPIHPKLIDDVMDAYIEWRHQSADVDRAYRRWAASPAHDTALAFAAYLAALDREEIASRSYALLITRNTAAYERDSWLREAA
jgi:hypothetical protein